MADKTIPELIEKNTIVADDMIPLDDGQQSYHIKFSTLLAAIPGVTNVEINQARDGILVTLRGVQNPIEIITHDSTKQDVLTFDDTPTSGSNNPVKSSGIYSDLSTLRAAISSEVETARLAESGLGDRITPLEQSISSLSNVAYSGNMSDLNEDATHRSVTDAEKTTWNSKQNALTFDAAPTSGSNNPARSGGIYTAIQAVQTALDDLGLVAVDGKLCARYEL